MQLVWTACHTVHACHRVGTGNVIALVDSSQKVRQLLLVRKQLLQEAELEWEKDGMALHQEIYSPMMPLLWCAALPLSCF